MKYNVKVKNVAQIRTEPTFSSVLLKTLTSEDDTTYTATKLNHGWYYLEEVYGWTQSIDVIVISIDEEYDDSDNNNPDVDNGGSSSATLTGDEIINKINKASYAKINANKIIFTMTDDSGTREINLDTMLKSMQLSLDDMQDVIAKVSTMPNIPSLPVMINGIKYVLKSYNNEDGTKKLVWEQVDYSEINNVPVDPVLAVEF